MNTFGHYFRLTTYGESHGAAVGGVIDGMPPGVKVDVDYIQRELDRRRPGQSRITTPRSEGDRVGVASGVFEGRHNGLSHWICSAQRAATFRRLRQFARCVSSVACRFHLSNEIWRARSPRRWPSSHAKPSVVWWEAPLRNSSWADLGVDIKAWTRQVGNVVLDRDYHELPLDQIEANAVRCPDVEVAAEMERLILAVRADGDTCRWGGGMRGARLSAGVGCARLRQTPRAVGRGDGWASMRPRASNMERDLPVAPCADRNSTMPSCPDSPRRPTTAAVFKAASPTDKILFFVWLSNRWQPSSATSKR